MPPKKKLSKKEKARLEAEQAELMRIEMEKEKLKKLEEERQRKQIEREQAKRRQQQEIKENKQRRAQLKNSMEFFNVVQETINAIKAAELEQSDWDKYMRCNGLPNANSPSELRKYIHQWQLDIKLREKRSRNWLLRTDERTILTQDTTVPDLSIAALRKKQGNLGDVYAARIKEVLGILNELNEALLDKKKSKHILDDLKQLKTEIRIFLKDHLDQFTYKTTSQIERDMEIDRPGVSKHIYTSDVFKSHIWTFSKDAQISAQPKARIGEQNQHHEIEFPLLEMQFTLPPRVELHTAAIRALWLNYDHLSDYSPSFNLKWPRPNNINILKQTKKEWRKRKEILQSMLDECDKETPFEMLQQNDSPGPQKKEERSNDVDKIYTDYEDELTRARKRAIGPDAYEGMLATDVNLRKYRIIGGVYCIDFLETPEQDKRLNSRSFIRTITSSEKLVHKVFYQTYKPPPPALPGVRRLPEEIEAEMRMIEAALDKLGSVTLQLPDSVIWFEPPIACRWETQLEALEADLTEGVKPPGTATPTEMTPLSTTTYASPLKGTPRFPTKARKSSSQQAASAPNAELPVREVTDFDMFNIPSKIDLYSLVKDFVVPRLPRGFTVRLGQPKEEQLMCEKKQPKLLFFARHESVNTLRPSELKTDTTFNGRRINLREQRINEDFMDLHEPREFFPHINFEKVLRLVEPAVSGKKLKEETSMRLVKLEGGKGGKAKDTKGSDKSNGKAIGQSGANSRNISRQGSESRSGYSTVASSRQSSEEHKVELSTRKCYMFSELLKDLDQLCEMEKPLQMEALNKISTNLGQQSERTDSQCEEDDAATAVDEIDDEIATEPQPFSFYTGLSIMRDLEAIRADNDVPKANKEGAGAEEPDDETSTDDDDAADEEDYYLNTKDADETMKANYGGGGRTVAPTAAGGVHDFLRKHHLNGNNNDSVGGATSSSSDGLLLTYGKWSTRDVHDTKFNEDKLSIQFRTGRLGIFGFALNRYSNMPYQTWEIKPDFKSPGTILLSFTASIVSLDMTITAAGYCLNNFQGGSTASINEMIGKILSLGELKAILIASAVDIFPEEDAFCYTEGSCEKNFVMEMHLYACMSTLALSHNFSWSRWNLLAGSRTAVLLMRELIEGKKVPYHSTLLVTPLKTAIIECTEVSASFNSAGIAGMEYYADLYQLSQVYALPSSLEKQRTMDPILRDNVARILMAIRPLSFC